MSGRLEFQTQLASIMEVLANAAVAEICKLVDDDYAVVSLQMSQCQRENKGLKRKLNLLELKMARGYAERRLRESAMNSRPNSRVHINTNDKFRESSLSTGGVYDIQLDPMGMWSGGPVANNDHNNSSQMHPNPIRDKSPDLQLVEPESLLVKEERMEDPLGDAEADDVTLIGEDGVVECGPRGGRGRTGAEDTPSHPPTSAHGPEQLSQPQHPEQQQQGPRNRHRVESAAVEDRDPDIVLIKVEDLDPQGGGLSIQEGLEESTRDNYRGGALPLEATHHTSPSDHTHHHPGTTRHHTTEVSYGRVSYENHPLPLWTNGGSGGSGDTSVPGPSSLNLSYPAGPGMLIMGGRMGPAGSEMGQHRGFTVEGSGSFSGSMGCREGSEMAGYEIAEAQGGQDMYKSGRKKVVRKKAYLCKFCGKGFSSPANLEPHLRTHTGERPFGCTVCGKHFSQYWNLKIHKNVHTGERPYPCALCGERFADPSNLKKHQKRHHPQQ